MGGAKLSGAKLSWCQIVLVPNCPLLLSWCQIFRFYYLGAKLSGAKLSGAKLSGAKLSWCQIVLVPNCLGAKLSTFIILVPNCPVLLSWCQIVRFYILVPNCPVPNCPTIKIRYHIFHF